MELRRFSGRYSKNGIARPDPTIPGLADPCRVEGALFSLLMQLTLVHIARPSSGAPKDGFEALTWVYLERCAAFAESKATTFKTEEALFDWAARQKGRTSPVLVLLDSRGRSMTSEAFAAWLGARRDEGLQHLVFAVGPADGWTDAARMRAGVLLSLGPMTIAHSLARLVLAEQIYRAFTILSGHPYHGGH
jgi:23S rRNA (pseudouridine1915-N3)-methyltransferase